MSGTIAAVSTAYGEGGIGIIRMSGSLSGEILGRLFISHGKFSATKSEAFHFEPRRMHYGYIVDPNTEALVDEVLAVFMPGPSTYTGEDVAEIQCHGSVVSLRKILALTLNQGARLADVGEFTKRAFLNGRIDLSQAEAVIDIIKSHTDRSFDAAMSQLSGRLSEEIDKIRDILSDVLADLVINIDYPEHEDAVNNEEVVATSLLESLTAAKGKILGLLETAKTGRMMREGIHVVLAGKPNVGKSSVLNCIMGESRAIVSEIAGTTRDSIESYADVRGIPLLLVDTAGIREVTDPLEKLGVDRSEQLIFKADVTLFVVDASKALDSEDIRVAESIQGKETIVLMNKADLGTVVTPNEVNAILPEASCVKFSALTGEGLGALEDVIESLVYGGRVKQEESLLVTNVRHESLLRAAFKEIAEAEEMLCTGEAFDFSEINIKAAYEYLGEITGKTVTDEVLEKVFSRFCVGK